MKIVIPFVCYKDQNPNIHNPSQNAFFDTYFKCICVAFASIKLTNPNIPLQLTTNAPPPDKYLQILSKLNVTLKIVPFTFNPIYLRIEKFRTCFYLFDALKNEDGDVLYVDPDVLCMNQINISGFDNELLGGLILNFPQNDEVNGISPKNAEIIYSRLSPNLKNPHTHIGGEFLYVPRARRDELNQKINELWKLNNQLSRNGSNFLTTEEHFLSCIFATESYSNLNQLGLRIWSTKLSKFSEGGFFDPNVLPLWHLPGEKEGCFLVLFQYFELNGWRPDVDPKNFRQKSLELINYKHHRGTSSIAKILKVIINGFR